MRVSIIALLNSDVSPSLHIINGIKKGLEKKEVHCDIFTPRDEVHFALYDYLIIVGETKGKFSYSFKDDLKAFLSSSSSLSGLRAASVVVNTFRRGRALQNLMGIMESEGLIVNESEFLKKEIDGEYFGKRLCIKRRGM